MPSETLSDRKVEAATRPPSRRGADPRRDAAASPLKRDRVADSNSPYAADDPRDYLRQQSSGRRVRRGLIPRSRFGRIAAATGLAIFLGGIAVAAYATVHFLQHDVQFTIPESAAIELRGNAHVSHAQLLSVFGEDVDRNIFSVPLVERQTQLETIPWVEHATVMRLLPNRIRVEVVERTPIAFVRQAGTIGLADASGVLLDIPPDAPGNPDYSFPVVTGLRAADSPESRRQRMHLYAAFLKDMDSGGKKLSADLSEVDLSDPEDVKALLPGGGVETLVHFGTQNFLARYNRFQEHIAEWRQQYPRLGSVDMRYEHQVVLQMPPKDSTVTAAGTHTADSVVSGGSAAAPGHAIAAPAAATHPAASHLAVAPVAVASPKAKPTLGSAARQADVAKRVEVIKAWMARRQQARDAARPRTASP